MSVSTLLLSRAQVARLLALDECIAAVEQAFRKYGLGELGPPGVLGMHAASGGFHVKAALMQSGRSYFAAKLNANFPGNPRRHALPTIQGVIMLCDAEKGSVLALMDSIEITIQRTGAASAVAARYLARADSHTVTVCGCGNQGRVQLACLRRVLPITQVFTYDQDPAAAEQFAQEVRKEVKLAAQPASNLSTALRASDVIVTCTPARQFFITREQVRPGTFIAAVGADNPEKQELEPVLLARSKVVGDILDQCLEFGDLHHAFQQGMLSREDVYAELGELAAGKKPGRTSRDEITVFDSTGTALQDVAAAVLVYEKALKEKQGSDFQFS